MDDQARREILAFIDSLKPLYPRGIPEHYMKEDASPEPPELEERLSVQVLFLTPQEATKEERDLIVAAATKGLQLPPSAFAIAPIEDASLYTAELQVSLGPCIGWREGEFCDMDGCRTLCTITATEALSGRAGKKKLWDHLQLLIPLL